MQGAILKNWNFCKQIEVLYRSEKYNQVKKTRMPTNSMNHIPYGQKQSTSNATIL